MTLRVPAWISLLLLWAVGFAAATAPSAAACSAPKCCAKPCCAHKGKGACLTGTPHQTQVHHWAAPSPVGMATPAPVFPPSVILVPARLEYVTPSTPPVERSGRSPPLRAPPSADR